MHTMFSPVEPQVSVRRLLKGRVPANLDERAARIEAPATLSTEELFALARRDLKAVIRKLDDFGDFWAMEIGELLEETTRQLIDAGLADDEAEGEDIALDWLHEIRPDLGREACRLEDFAWNLARKTRNPAPLRTAAHQHHHWGWWDLASGLQRRRHDRRPGRLPGRRNGRAPRMACNARRRGSRRVGRTTSSGDDGGDLDPPGESDLEPAHRGGWLR